ncbi:MAG TPA: type II toxin-antitoxin system HicB family antitoxin [Stenomitos sp.]
MKDMMEYKGYYGSVHYNDADQVFYGKVEYIRSLISYEGEDVATLRSSFEEAVDDYLDLCEHQGQQPEQSFKGSFNIRPGVKLHRQAAIAAQKKGINLNKLVTDALEQYLEKSQSR